MSEAMFDGAHGPEGVWRSEKGPMLAPHEAGPLLSGNTGDPRFNGVAGDIGWAANVIVTTGMTGPNNDLPK